MAVELATTISGLNATWPLGSDAKAEGDDHLRLIKSVLKTQYAGDLWYGQRTTPDRWVWNDKADGTGTDVATLSETGVLTTAFALLDAGRLNFRTGTTATFEIAGVAFLAASAGVLEVPGRNISAKGAPGAQPAVICYAQDRGTALGIWNRADNRLGLGAATATGAPVTSWIALNDAGMIMSGDTAAKPTAGGWVASSDARIKTVTRTWTGGLDIINGLVPKAFSFKGNDSHEPLPDKSAATPYENSSHYQLAVDGTEYIGLIAQEVEPVFPECITNTSGYIDGEPVDDLKMYDQTPIIYALINAVKELSARLEALEATP